jgi:hypothetical protein
MRKIGSSLLILAALVLLGPPVAQAEHEFVGFTNATMTGDTGVLRFTLACQDHFGPTARMCDSLEVMRTTSVPGGLIGDAWVRPVFQPTGTADVVDASGASTSSISNFTCYGWSYSGSGNSGFTVDLNGSFGFYTCDFTNPVACCVPVPEPLMATVPSILWFGRGLLAALMLSAAGAALMFRGRPLLTSGKRGISRRW